MKIWKPVMVLIIPFSILLASTHCRSETAIQIDVKTILASQEKGAIDPQLRGLTQELQTVFRYSSYSLLSRAGLSLDGNNRGVISLPENRTMRIVSRGVNDDRVTLELEILKDKRQIFKTVIRLRNRSSITIGGPEYRGGNLLFNISASF